MTKSELGRITSTHLGFHDGGVLTFWLNFDFGGNWQGFGGYSLVDDGASLVIEGILEALAVDKWEDLTGKVCWVERDDDVNPRIVAIEAPKFIKGGGRFDIREVFKTAS